MSPTLRRGARFARVFCALATASPAGCMDRSPQADAATDDAASQDAGPEADGGSTDSGSSDEAKLHGAAEKGPFLLGSSVTISVTDAEGELTGLTYLTSTSDDLGAFTLTLAHHAIVALEATGFYYNEVTGALSRAPIMLRGWCNANGDDNTANLNVVTHLANRRVAHLLQQQVELHDAVQQAETELVTALGLAHAASFSPGTSLTLTQSAYLFALSAVLEEAGRARGGNDAADAQLQDLLNHLASDLELDGTLEASAVVELRAAENSLDPDAAYANLAARMAALGLPGSPPDIDQVLDSDLDGLLNDRDNCPNTRNADQTDMNGDGIGDACCGNGKVEGAEECDDGSTNANTQQCTLLCLHARCGDGFLFSDAEQCDDGNQDDADACTNACLPRSLVVTVQHDNPWPQSSVGDVPFELIVKVEQQVGDELLSAPAQSVSVDFQGANTQLILGQDASFHAQLTVHGVAEGTRIPLTVIVTEPSGTVTRKPYEVRYDPPPIVTVESPVAHDAFPLHLLATCSDPAAPDGRCTSLYAMLGSTTLAAQGATGGIDVIVDDQIPIDQLDCPLDKGPVCVSFIGFGDAGSASTTVVVGPIVDPRPPSFSH